MAASYTTELEALNAIYDLLDAMNTSITTKLAAIDGHIDGVEAQLATTHNKLNSIIDYIDGVEGKLDTLHNDVDTVETKLETANTNLASIIGETVDVRNVPTDTCIIRIYVGDITEKREKASQAVTTLLADGYRPYMVMGISEDLARVLFVKYPAPNASNA